MLAVSRQTDYACRVLLHLALQPAGARVTTAEIARQRLIPPALIRRIVTSLSVAGLVKTTRGSAGGMVLARPSGEISLLDVVQAMEGPIALNPCTIAPAGDPDHCPFIPACPVHDTWVEARAALLQKLGQTTFADMARRGGSGMTFKDEEVSLTLEISPTPSSGQASTQSAGHLTNSIV